MSPAGQQSRVGSSTPLAPTSEGQGPRTSGYISSCSLGCLWPCWAQQQGMHLWLEEPGLPNLSGPSL